MGTNGEVIASQVLKMLNMKGVGRSFLRDFTVYNQDDPDRILCVQHWVNRKSYESYVTWRKKSGDLDISSKELGGHKLAEPPIIRFFDPTDI